MGFMIKLLLLLNVLLLSSGSAFSPFGSKPYLTPTASPTNSIYVNWNTENKEPSVMAFGLTLALEDTIRIAGERNHHHVLISNLAPGTEYYYRVLPQGSVNRFRIFPEYSDSFAFIVFGDTRGDSIVHQSVIDQIASYDFEFLVHTGDLVLDGDDTEGWRTFFNVEDTLLQHKHFVPALGNHEKPYWPYDTLFALPDSEFAYSVRYGNAVFIILNTEGDVQGFQKRWLMDRLKAVREDKSIDWVFAVFHRPAYSAGRYGDRMHVREAWSDLFEKYNVDIAFAGHDHNYQRTEKINGVIYVITGGGSAVLYGVQDRKWLAHGEPVYHFCLLEIKGKRLILQAIRPDRTVFDALVIEKSEE
jgi:hypothetical protein